MKHTQITYGLGGYTPGRKNDPSVPAKILPGNVVEYREIEVADEATSTDQRIRVVAVVGGGIGAGALVGAELLIRLIGG